MKKILLTNDDGYQSTGFLALLKELSKSFDATACAPDRERSWISKSITTKTPLAVKKRKVLNTSIYCCSGTPADCTQIGLYHILKEKPDYVVSGMNLGANVGNARILSSGTIGAAMEASINGIKAFASSIYIPKDVKSKYDFFDKNNVVLLKNAAKITVKIMKMMACKTWDKSTDIISINIPYGATIDSEIEITRPFRDNYGKLFIQHNDKYIQSSPPVTFNNLEKGIDLNAIYQGKISITPISLAMINNKSLKILRSLLQR